ncbi:MAG TPA: hypothetical protein VGE63_00110 [Candidatus Paceibacterota bacterium]
MKKLIVVILMFSFAETQVMAQKDTTKVAGILTMNAFASSKGIAPIPAFSLDGPAGAIFSNFTYQRFEFQFDYSYSLKGSDAGKGWFSDLWVRYNQPIKKNSIITLGFDWSGFYQPLSLTDAPKKVVHQSIRYPTYQLKYSMHHKNALIILDYWFTHALEKEYGVRGHYLSFSINDVYRWKKFDLTSSGGLYGISYSDNSNGWGAVYDASFGYKGFYLGGKVNLLSVISQDVKVMANITIGYSVSLDVIKKK